MYHICDTSANAVTRKAAFSQLLTNFHSSPAKTIWAFYMRFAVNTATTASALYYYTPWPRRRPTPTYFEAATAAAASAAAAATAIFAI